LQAFQTTSATSGEGTVNTSGTPEFTPVLNGFVLLNLCFLCIVWYCIALFLAFRHCIECPSLISGWCLSHIFRLFIHIEKSYLLWEIKHIVFTFVMLCYVLLIDTYIVIIYTHTHTYIYIYIDIIGCSWYE
jgi:hypothetical protein